MSKPLTIVLEIIGGIMILVGLMPPLKIGVLSIGLILMLIGVVGIRKRLKKG